MCRNVEAEILADIEKGNWAAITDQKDKRSETRSKKGLKRAGFAIYLYSMLQHTIIYISRSLDILLIGMSFEQLYEAKRREIDTSQPMDLEAELGQAMTQDSEQACEYSI